MNWLRSFWKALNTPQAPTSHHSSKECQVITAATRTGLPADLGELTPRAQQVLMLARREAERFNHNFVGTEHLLLGLISLGQGPATDVIQKMGLTLEMVRSEVEKAVGPGPDQRVLGKIPYTPRVKKVLALANKERKELNHTYLGTEHILLGLLREGDGVAGRILTQLGMNAEITRQMILRELDPNYRSTSPESARTHHAEPQKRTHGPVDVRKRYDVYCREGNHTLVYRNALFKGMRTLFPKNERDIFSEYIELEQGNGSTILIAKASVVKFCEHGTTPECESLA